MEESNHLPWPVLSHYDQEHTGRIALPIGGIGTGTVSLSGRVICKTGRSSTAQQRGSTRTAHSLPSGQPQNPVTRLSERSKEYYRQNSTRAGAALRPPMLDFRVSVTIPSNQPIHLAR